MGLVFLGTAIVSPGKAKAADSDWNQIDLAKKVIQNVAPIVTEIQTGDSSASLTLGPQDFIQKPLVVDTQITPEDLPPQLPLALPVEKAPVAPKPQPTPKPAPAPQPQKVVAASISTSTTDAAAHKFPYGYCTYYVAQKRYVPWGGNAITWLSGARSYGFATGSQPKPGAIMVTNEGGYAGHVAYVESVNGNMITVSEMNYKGFGVVSTRTISASSSFILGFIY